MPPAVATKDSSLAAIFLFELEENKTIFSGAALDKKCSITTMYMKATVNNTPIKLILDNRSAGSITKTQKTPPTTIVTIVTKKNTVTQKDMENGMRNHALLVENHYQKSVTGMIYQAEEKHVMQLANTQSSSVTE
ncbi:hypothetical protein G9A89_013987 [Geosiphon pyriformis]|nr:hypothetical protein G9A89_013987 [Geosiphon pyriformis]